jgi:choline dehydrogenase
VPVRASEGDTSRFQSIVTWDGAGDSGADLYDIHLSTAGPFDDGSGGAVAGLSFSYLKPRSRGSVRLRSVDPDALPVVDPGFLNVGHDADRLVGALREMRRLARTPPLSELILGDELAPAPGIDDGDTEGLTAAIRVACASYFHPVGSCRMGPDPDDGAVVDARGRVHGIDSLVVADASVMPEIPSAGTNLPTMMVAERIASFMAAG